MKSTYAIIAAIVVIVIIIGGVFAYISLSGSPKTTPTPSPAPTATSSPSPTSSPTPTTKPTATPTPTQMATASPTPSPTPSPSPTPTPTPTTLTVATTTSLYQTGLEDTPEVLANGTTLKDDIKDTFQATYPWITINFVAVGTGVAITDAESGSADMLLVHSPSQELPFLTGGYGVDRKIVAYNFFVIVGPASDPAHIRGLTNVTQAMIDIYNAAQVPNSNVLWFSRDDASGTNTKEISLWTSAGYNYTQLLTQTSWFKSTGTGMGPTLLAANYYGNIGGYTLSDTGTYYAYYDRGDIQSQIQIQAQQSLLNVYSAIIDNPQNSKLANTNFNASMTFVNWLVSDAGQQTIANYGVASYNQTLFNPFVALATNPAINTTLYGWIQSYAYINSVPVINANGTECPPQYRYDAGNLYTASYDVQMANMIPNSSLSDASYLYVDIQKPINTQLLTYSQSKGKTLEQ
ncbi:MAG: substrate-binding domain-containing protein [Candidatus Bathyarchaeia archaeon]